MKNCPQCFAQYPDEYSVCPKDGTRLAGSSVWEPEAVIRGKYKILGKIGEGGMAAVYRARHLLLDEPCALKVIGWDLTRDKQFVQRFKNEAIITRKLRHPNAVRVDDLDLGEDGRPFIAMELVEGESLKSLMLRAGPLEVRRVLDIALQVCEALQAAHALGLIHRDIKPDNIVLVPRPDSAPLVKILDFGIARLKEGTSGAGLAGMTLTGTGVVIGTPEYMSPEQAMGKRGEQLDGRSDLYSLGIVMYRMLTGELPFKADTTVEMILHHIQTVPKPPETIKPELGIPPSVSGLVMKALEKDRDRRFASAAAMAETIRRTQASLTATGPAATEVARRPHLAPVAQPAKVSGLAVGAARGTPVAAQAGARREQAPLAPAKRGFPTRFALLGAVLVVLILVGVAALKRRERTPSPPETTPAPAPASAPSVTSQPAPQTSAPAQPPPPSSSSSAGTGTPTAEGARRALDRTRPEGVDRLPAPAGDSATQPREARPRPDLSRAPSQVEKEQSSQWEQLRQLYHQAGQSFAKQDYGNAARAFRQILAIDPSNVRARMGLRKALERLGHAKPPNQRSRPQRPRQSPATPP